jgi:hypothetical protein
MRCGRNRDVEGRSKTFGIGPIQDQRIDSHMRADPLNMECMLVHTLGQLDYLNKYEYIEVF